MNKIVCLNPDYSTTRCLIYSSSIINGETASSKYKGMQLLPDNTERTGEGGLRTQGYFKIEDCLDGEAKCLEKTTRKPLVTIITVVFNGADTLEKTILSVISQSYTNIEYIIIDGGSTDGTIDIIRKHEHAIDYWVSEPDTGIYDAWNKGVRLSNGEWIAFLGADDSYLEEAINAYIDSILSNENSSVLEYVSSRVNLINGTRTLRVIGAPWNWKVFRKYMNVAHIGSFHHRAIFDKYGLYDTTYKICGDYELLLRAKSALRAGYLEKITANMEIGGKSNNNVLTFSEASRAKIKSGGRNRVVSQIEKIMAILKWKARTYLWQ
ncbi:MAG: glycosyltransferase [Gammaproteobacteria bacterium]|nr:glycosyltransferase [Gammaproteobacteria bacterium]